MGQYKYHFKDSVCYCPVWKYILLNSVKVTLFLTDIKRIAKVGTKLTRLSHDTALTQPNLTYWKQVEKWRARAGKHLIKV